VSAWTPILEGGSAARAVCVVNRIYADVTEALDKSTHPAGDLSLAIGLAGLALFEAYRARCLGLHDDLVRQRLAEAIADCDPNIDDVSLFHGASGLALVVALSQRLADGTVDASPFCTEVDAVLMDALAHADWHCRAELFRGLAGIGIYALERRSESLLTEVKLRLRDIAYEDEAGPRWLTDSSYATPPYGLEGLYVNLGMPHGIWPPIAVVGATLLKHEPEIERRFFDLALSWALSQQGHGVGSQFPLTLPSIGSEDGPLAWCYGDLGIGSVLVAIGTALGRSDLTMRGADIALRVATWPTKFADPCLCHGSAGTAHLFNRLFHSTGDERFLAASRQWFRATLNVCHADRPVAGLSFFRRQHWTPDLSYLRGASGVALALLGAIGATAPDWDAPLCLSFRDQARTSTATACVPAKR